MKVPKEREKLIALSDLNREDNIKYISSEAQGIAIALDSDRYAPTLCKLERAYICGRRKSEEQIEQLEKANEMQALRMKERDELLSELEKQSKAKKQQLTKAKVLLAKWVELYKPKGGNVPPTPIQIDTEQFLKESEK